ncbi:hypothetical protein [Streptomyces sp. NBC_00724]|uniref:hypothetical protein n=1 Tax=Streptomyces sp. NBC_00724 TaxID=2975812 RepID=UPI002ED3DB2B
MRRLSSARPFRDGEFYDAASKLDTDAKGLGCRSAARIDFMVTSDGQVYALEVNTTPGMSRESN